MAGVLGAAFIPYYAHLMEILEANQEMKKSAKGTYVNHNNLNIYCSTFFDSVFVIDRYLECIIYICSLLNYMIIHVKQFLHFTSFTFCNLKPRAYLLIELFCLN